MSYEVLDAIKVEKNSFLSLIKNQNDRKVLEQIFGITKDNIIYFELCTFGNNIKNIFIHDDTRYKNTFYFNYLVLDDISDVIKFDDFNSNNNIDILDVLEDREILSYKDNKFIYRGIEWYILIIKIMFILFCHGQ